MRKFGIICIAIFAAGIFQSTSAKDFKIGYVDSDRILEVYAEFQEARNQLQEEEQAFINEEKETELSNFRRDTWGEGGKLYTRNLELSKPILEKINTAIETISQQDGYDMVFDAASGNIVFAQPQYDITQLVLDSLEK
jgi:Skp family chaperone for outer membrane proteins